MERIKLSPRLQAIAEWIPVDSNVADVGTDHGYIPIWLAQGSCAGLLAACDIHEGPLANARLSAKQYGVSEHIRFELCNGLDFPGSEAYETIVIAGMGGELICSILEQAPWTRAGQTLILQPNSKIDLLSEWLDTHGYRINNARLVKDSGKLYQILSVSGGESRGPFTTAQYRVDRLYFERKDPLLPAYLDQLIAKYERSLLGLVMGKDTAQEQTAVKTVLSELIEMKKETETWQL